jgi:hypothetical protein
MNHTEEELQLKIEQGLSVEPSLDAQLYRKIYGGLKQETEFQLPVHFADKLIERLEGQSKKSHDHLWIALGVGTFVVAASIVIYVTGFRANLGVFKFLSGYAGLVVFGVAFIVGLQLLDKKIIHHKLSADL